MRYVDNSFGSGKKLISMLLLILMSIGVIGGVYLVCRHSNWDWLYSNYITQGFTEDTSSKTLLDVFLNAISWTGYILVIVYICGYSAIGHPVSLLMILSRGMALGVTVCKLYLDYSSKGIIIFILMVMVHAIVSTVVLMFATITSLTQSTVIACTILGRSSDTISLQRYNLKFLSYVSIIVASSIIDTILTYVFINRLLITS